MTNKEIARTLSETADLIELTGGNAFRARAFRSAGRTLERLETPAPARLADDTLTNLDGIGSGMAGHVAEIIRSGSFGLRDDLLGALPPGLLDVLRVKGLGTKRVRKLWQELHVTSLDELEQAAASGRLATLDGFGKKTQANVLENVSRLRRYAARRRWADALTLAAPVLDALRAADGVKRAEPAGALRRNLETVEHIDLAAAAADPAPVHAVLDGQATDVSTRSEDGEALLEGTLPDGFPLRVHVAPPERFGTAWWQATGSKAHRAAFEEAHDAPAAYADETAVYTAAGLPFIDPALREGRGELEAAAENRLPRLLTTDDLQGVLHNHSTYSDGAHTLHQMAEAARQVGFSYFGICDHSRSLAIANGLSAERVRKQQDEIRTLNEEFAADDGPPFRIFSGIESDILSDGSLDYPDEVLASFDLVVASVHSGLSMSEEEATERLLRVIENPYTTILGHATGRLLLRREGYPIDHARVIEACAAHDVAIELNANPYRLDMDWRPLRTAIERGVLIAINPDAHATSELGYVRYGVAVARKAWLTPDGCLNARSLDAFTEWLG